MTNILLIRHGNSEAVDYAPGRMTGVHLSDEGRRQAERTAGKLSSFKIDRIFSSPLERTRETAEIIASKIDRKVEILENLLELDLGDWTGKTFVQLEDIPKWGLYHTFRSATRIPSGELFIEVQNRMIRQINDLKEKYPSETIILVSHGDPIRSAVAFYAGIPVDFTTRIVIDTASVTMIAINEYTAVVNFVNKWGFHLKD